MIRTGLWGPSGSYAWGKVAGRAADLPKVTGCRYHRHEPGGAEPGLVLPQADLIIAIQLADHRSR